MTYLSLIPFILAIYQHAKIGKCAYINISLSATSVQRLQYVNIYLEDMYPACCTSGFKNISLKVIAFGGNTTHQLAHYDKKYKRLRLTTPLPLQYQSRLHATGQRILFTPVKFEDEGTKFYFQYYHNGSSNFVESRHVELKTVYAASEIQSPTLPAVTFAPVDTSKTMTCTVRSRPTSQITWSHDPKVTGVVSQNVTVQGHYFITTGTFNITRISFDMDRKNITCIGDASVGLKAMQNTTLFVTGNRTQTTATTITGQSKSQRSKATMTDGVIGSLLPIVTICFLL